jgi:hypothetical protein
MSKHDVRSMLKDGTSSTFLGFLGLLKEYLVLLPCSSCKKDNVVNILIIAQV